MDGAIDDSVMLDLVAVFGSEWEAERQRIGRGIAPKGAKTEAGLKAVFDRLVEHGLMVVPIEPTA